MSSTSRSLHPSDPNPRNAHDTHALWADLFDRASCCSWRVPPSAAAYAMVASGTATGADRRDVDDHPGNPGRASLAEGAIQPDSRKQIEVSARCHSSSLSTGETARRGRRTAQRHGSRCRSRQAAPSRLSATAAHSLGSGDISGTNRSCAPRSSGLVLAC